MLARRWVPFRFAFSFLRMSALPTTATPPRSPFEEAVYAAVRQIPPGETRTYQEIAAAIGRPTAHRAVANALAKNPFHNAAACGDAYVPCHRVVSANPKCPDCGYLGSKEPDRLAQNAWR